MEKATLRAKLAENDRATIHAEGMAADQVVLAADAAAVIAAHYAIDQLADGESPESALEKLISAIRYIYWEEYKGGSCRWANE